MIRSSNVLLLLVALFGLLAAPSLASAQAAGAAAPAAGAKIAIVDMAKAINDTNEGKAAKSRLEREMTRRQQELDRKQREFETFATELQASFNMLSDSVKEQKMQTYQQKAAEIQELFMTHQQELARAESEATSRIVERLTAVVQQVAQRGSYTLVLDKAAVLYSVGGTDITAQVVSAYNERHR